MHRALHGKIVASVGGSQRHCSSSANISELADRGTASLRLRLAVSVGLRVKGLVGSNVADDPRTLVREASEREGLADLEDLFAVFFVAQDRIPGRVRSCTVGWRERLVAPTDQYSLNAPLRRRSAHLRWYVVVKVPGVFWTTQFGSVRGRVLVYVLPVDAAEPWVSLRNGAPLAMNSCDCGDEGIP